MKRICLYILLAILPSIAFVSCNSEELDDTSVFIDSTIQRTDFENWLYNEYTKPYNIDFKYRMEDIESDMNYNLSPASVNKAKEMAVLLKHLCLDTYTEVTGSTEFVRSTFPKVVHLVGSAAYRNNGTMVLGTAEGGLKMSLYYINEIRLNDNEHLKDYYFKTIFHEYAHIFHQKKPYSKDFDQLTAGGYVTDSWNTAWSGDAAARQAGFISRYASKAPDEDFVEILAHYVINTEAQWTAIINQGGTAGGNLMKSKFDIVYNYMINSWDIDLNEVRRIYLEKQAVIMDLEYKNLQ